MKHSAPQAENFWVPLTKYAYEWMYINPMYEFGQRRVSALRAAGCFLQYVYFNEIRMYINVCWQMYKNENCIF